MHINHCKPANNYADCTILHEQAPISSEPSTQARKSSISPRQLAFPIMQWWFQTLTHSIYLPFPQSQHSQKIAMPPKFQANTPLGFVSILSCLLKNLLLSILSTLLFSISSLLAPSQKDLNMHKALQLKDNLLDPVSPSSYFPFPRSQCSKGLPKLAVPSYLPATHHPLYFGYHQELHKNCWVPSDLPLINPVHIWVHTLLDLCIT